MKRDNVIERHPHSAVDDGSLGLPETVHKRVRGMSRKQLQRAMNRASGGELDRLEGLRQLARAKKT